MYWTLYCKHFTNFKANILSRENHIFQPENSIKCIEFFQFPVWIFFAFLSLIGFLPMAVFEPKFFSFYQFNANLRQKIYVFKVVISPNAPVYFWVTSVIL